MSLERIAGYRIEPGLPPVEDYVALRLRAGLSGKTPEQAEAAIAGTWSSCRAIEEASGAPVGMGRVIGDGGWYFHIVDMAVYPDHQRRGIGDALLTRLLDEIHSRAPAGATVTLLADPPGRKLYLRRGFLDGAPKHVGMLIPPPG